MYRDGHNDGMWRTTFFKRRDCAVPQIVEGSQEAQLSSLEADVQPLLWMCRVGSYRERLQPTTFVSLIPLFQMHAAKT
jgi:hypothetical protein